MKAVTNICYLIFKFSKLLEDFEGYADNGPFMSRVFLSPFQGFCIRGNFESFQSAESFLLTTNYASKNYKNRHLINKPPVFF
jgi:hypothetical protein